ncbi:MAG TPA: GNAT family N-acetyltransferase, partial [Chloroflexota bacterium]|nr:GNAT family N-acetyltransferase [Chloroflexota bacterium]
HQFGSPELRAVVVWHGADAVGLLPLYIYFDPATGERKLLPLGAGTTDYLDGVFHPECSAGDIQKALEVLAEDSGWDVLDVLQLRAGSPLGGALAAMPRAQWFAAAPCWRMPALPISELPVKVRRHAMYYRNRAARQGALSLEFANPATLATMFDDLVRMHTERWHQAGKPGVLADPRVLAWHREALPLLHAAGLLRLCALRRHGETLAIAYALADPAARAAQVVGRAQYVYIHAYSPEHADLRPGTVLLALAMEEAAQEGIRTIDMLRGDEGYKQQWHGTPVPTLAYRLPHPPLAATQAA